MIRCGMEALPLYGWCPARSISTMCSSCSHEHDVPLVPFFMAAVVGREELLLDDRLHRTLPALA